MTCVLLVLYAFSIVFGRLYTGMHGFSDCAVGVAIGCVVSLGQWISEDWMENWMRSPGWTGNAL